MKKMPLHLFISDVWTQDWRKVLVLSIQKYFKDKDFEIKFVNTLTQADIVLCRSQEEESCLKDTIPPEVPCLYMIKKLKNNPTQLAQSSFGKLPHSINLIGLGIQFGRNHPKD